MRYYIFSKIDLNGGDHQKHWKVAIPDIGDKGFYRSIVSLDAFCHGLKGRCYDSKDKRDFKRSGYLYYGRRLEEYELDRGIWLETVRRCPSMQPKEAVNPLRPDPAIMEEVPSIWDFYKIIGYDYKRNKYSAPC